VNIERVNGVKFDNIGMSMTSQYAMIVGDNHTILNSIDGHVWCNECGWDLKAVGLVIIDCYNQTLIGKKLQLIDKSEYDKLKYRPSF